MPVEPRGAGRWRRDVWSGRNQPGGNARKGYQPAGETEGGREARCRTAVLGKAAAGDPPLWGTGMVPGPADLAAKATALRGTGGQACGKPMSLDCQIGRASCRERV